MAILKPDATSTLGGVTVNEYLLTAHNPNKIDMPQTSMEGRVLGATIHNTDWITVASGTTPAEQYTRATVNGNMNDVRVHYYVDDVCAWQNLPLTLAGWHAADGSGNGNRRTVAIECIMSKNGTAADKKSEDNCAKLAAALLKQFGLGIENLYTHTYWMNVRDGKAGSVDELNVMWNRTKMCPAYILPHWAEFKALVQKYLDAEKKPDVPKQLYRVRKSWSDAGSQIGAYSVLKNAVAACKDGYSVYDNDGIVVYSATSAEQGSCKYATPTSPVKFGDGGESVRWLQWQLTAIGYSCGDSGIDGDFGKNTERGLKYFQEANDLEIDGVCGPMTRAALLAITKSEYVPDTGGQTGSGFTPRFTEPSKDNRYYISVGEGGWNPGIPRPSGSKLWFANCVFYTLGRFAELWKVWLPSTNAENFVNEAKRLGYPVSQTPTLGSIIVWAKGRVGDGSDGAGHVACVEKINDDGSIVISQSGWSASIPFWTQTLKPGWYYGDGYTFLGFVQPK